MEQIGNYASIYHSGAFYIFGGYFGEEVEVSRKSIARLDEVTHEWSEAWVGKVHNNFEVSFLCFFVVVLCQLLVQGRKVEE